MPIVPEVITLDTVLDGREYYVALRIITIDNRAMYLSTSGRSIARLCARRPSGICRIATDVSGIQWKRVLSSYECNPSDFFGMSPLPPVHAGTRYFTATLARYSRRCTVEIELTPRAVKPVDKTTKSYTRIDGKLKRVKSPTPRPPRPSKRKIHSYRENFAKRWL